MEKKKLELKPLEKVQKVQEISGPVYMGKDASFICADNSDAATMRTTLVAEHINPDNEDSIEFPRFVVNKTGAINNGFGMFSKNVLALDTDEEPTEGSINLITSGVLFNIIQELQDQIDDLKFSISE